MKAEINRFIRKYRELVLRVFQKTGLVEIIPRCGARVRKVTEESIRGFCDVFGLLFGHVVRR